MDIQSHSFIIAGIHINQICSVMMMMILVVGAGFDGISAVSWQRNLGAAADAVADADAGIPLS